MAKTLREQYEAKKVKSLQERLVPIDKKVISELRWSENDQLIYEAFDKNQMNQAIKTVKQLKTINFGALGSLAAGRDAAVNDVTSALAGSSSKGLIRKIVGLFKSGKENPLVDSLAFCDALNNFFGQFSQYVTALGGENQDQPLATIITGKNPDELDDLTSIQGLGSDEKKKLKDMQNVILKGFKPNGTLGKLSKNWIDKYMKGKKGMQQLAKDLLKMTPKDLNVIGNSVAGALKNAEAVGQAAAGASQQATTGSNPSAGTKSANSTQPEQGTSHTKSGDAMPGAQIPPNVAPKGNTNNLDVKQVTNHIKSAMENIGVPNVDVLVKMLSKLNVLKNPE